jgi:hypothetical protein
LRWTLGQRARELTEMRPGGALMTEHLGHVLFINVLRAHMAHESDNAVGWLKGLNDPHVG